MTTIRFRTCPPCGGSTRVAVLTRLGIPAEALPESACLCRGEGWFLPRPEEVSGRVPQPLFVKFTGGELPFVLVVGGAEHSGTGPTLTSRPVGKGSPQAEPGSETHSRPDLHAAAVLLLVQLGMEFHPPLPADGTRQACDLCLGNDNLPTHILSPYPQHRSALTDCARLAASALGARKAILIFGYSYLAFRPRAAGRSPRAPG